MSGCTPASASRVVDTVRPVEPGEVDDCGPVAHLLGQHRLQPGGGHQDVPGQLPHS